MASKRLRAYEIGNTGRYKYGKSARSVRKKNPKSVKGRRLHWVGYKNS